MNIRVVKADGSTPGIGSYLLRWLLFPIDGPVTGGLGLLVVLLTQTASEWETLPPAHGNQGKELPQDTRQPR